MKRVLWALWLGLHVGLARAQADESASDDFSAAWDAIMGLTPPGGEDDEGERAAPPTTERRGRQAKGEPAPEKKRSSHRTRAPRARTATAPGYEALKRFWHEPWPDDDSAWAETAPPLVLHPVAREASPIVLAPNDEEGGFAESDLVAASLALGSWQNGPVIAERLLDLVYHAALTFGVYHVHVVSGVRHDRGGSRHSHGLALDIVMPGVEDEELASYFRAQGFVGVGVYTRAGFVHVDVRERSYFWLDRSPPGRRYKIQQIHAQEAKAADDAARARGDDGFVNPERLKRALHKREKRRRARHAGASMASSRAKAER